MHSDEIIKKIGENLRTKYLYNIYNDVDVASFFEAKHQSDKKIKEKINYLINALY